MGKITLRPLTPDDPIFQRGPVMFSPSAIRDSLLSRADLSDEGEPSTPTPASEKPPSSKDVPQK